MCGTSLRQSSANSHAQHCSGEEDPIHLPLSYFLLIVIFVAIKETVIVVNTALLYHLFARLHAVLPLPSQLM
jgi:hypothetical protein